MQRLAGHAHECHDLKKLVLSSFAELLHIIATLLDEGIIVAQEVGPLKDSVELQLPKGSG